MIARTELPRCYAKNMSLGRDNRETMLCLRKLIGILKGALKELLYSEENKTERKDYPL